MSITRIFNFAVFLLFGGAILWLARACADETIDIDAGKNAITLLLVIMIAQIGIEMFLTHRRGQRVKSAMDDPRRGFDVSVTERPDETTKRIHPR